MTFLKSCLLAMAIIMLAGPLDGGARAADTVTTTYSLSNAGITIRKSHIRTVDYTTNWLLTRRYMRKHYTAHSKPRRIRRRSSYYGAGFYYVGSGLYTLRPSPRYDFSCRFLADCPCRFLAGC